MPFRLAWSCYTIQMFHQCLGVLLFMAILVYLAPLIVVLGVHKLPFWAGVGRGGCLLSPVTWMCLQNSWYLWKHHWNHCIFSLLVICLLSSTSLFCARSEIVRNVFTIISGTYIAGAGTVCSVFWDNGCLLFLCIRFYAHILLVWYSTHYLM